MPYVISPDFSVDQSIDYAGDYGAWFREYRLAPFGTPPPLTEPLIGYVEHLPNLAAPPPVMGDSRLLFVSEKVKLVIEGMEPGIHDFVPMEIRYGTRSSYASFRYFALRINQSFDPIDYARSDIKTIEQPNGNKVLRKKIGVPVVIIPELTAGKHLWIYHNVFCSDELHDALVEHGLTAGWKFEKQLVS